MRVGVSLLKSAFPCEWLSCEGGNVIMGMVCPCERGLSLWEEAIHCVRGVS